MMDTHSVDSAKQSLRQYIIITANYWGFTLTDGALRMLVVMHFHSLGYAPLEIAFLFVFYELFGVFTNLAGGWIGAHFGLNTTMNLGLALQLCALSMLLVNDAQLTLIWVMTAQAISGIAKDLNKMSAKSAIKILVPATQQSKLFQWVARLTGSKNTLKGIGFFLGAALLESFGFRSAVQMMLAGLLLVFVCSLCLLQRDLGKASRKPKFKQIFSKSALINKLSAARLFLFAARDAWFVIALPVYFTEVLHWQHHRVGAFFAVWIILYGLVQAGSPSFIKTPSAVTAEFWLRLLLLLSLVTAVVFYSPFASASSLIISLILFCFVFAMNSSIHSYLIVQYSSSSNTSLDVGFYYMANASGRLLGTVTSGLSYQLYGLGPALALSAIFLVFASVFTMRLKREQDTNHWPQ